MFKIHQLHRFAIRKYAVGVCSVMVASLLFLGADQVSANQLVTAQGAGTEQVVASSEAQPLDEITPESEGDQQETVSEPLQAPTSETVTEQSAQSVTKVTNSSPEAIQTVKSEESRPSSRGTSQATKPSVAEVLPENPTDISVTKAEPTETKMKDVEKSNQEAVKSQATEALAPPAEILPEPPKLTPAKFAPGTAFRSFGTTRSATPAGVIGDDYPARWKYSDPNSDLDSWNLYVRNCTSFAAYRLSSVNGIELPVAYGNAKEWGGRARSEGYRVDNSPARGSIAWALPSATNSEHGHVAWVAAVSGDMVTVEEYNYNYLNPYTYVTRTVHKSAFTGYIHFKDLGHGSVVAAPNASSSMGASHGLPAQGTYTFTQRTGVKNEPKLASPDRATYEAGESVHYDKVLESDNHVWLSYTNYSGSRSYVAIKALPATTNRPTTGKLQVHTTDAQTGDFDVIISDVYHAGGVQEVQVPIWSDKGGQDDIVWYRAQHQGGSTYKVSVQTSRHKNDTGTYHVHLYYVQNDGKQVGAGALTTQVNPQPQSPNRPTSGNLHIQTTNTQTGDFDVIISDVYHAGGVQEVQVPIWSDKGGQDDIVWYRAQHQGGSTYKVSVQTSRHKNDTGTYHVHLYYVQNDGRQVGAGGTSTEVTRQQISSTTIAPSGVYHFTKTLPIKNQASMASPTLDYYYSGETVNYDRVVTAEGRQWLSYMSHSGLRRYIPLN